MDERTKHMCEGCVHGFCGGGHGALRWIIGVIIFMLIFWMGMRVGEIKSEFYGGYGTYGEYPGYGMMRRTYMYDYPAPAAPTTVVVPTTVKATK